MTLVQKLPKNGFEKCNHGYKNIDMLYLSGTKGILTLLIDPTLVDSKKSSPIQWPVPSINAEPVDIFLGE